MPMVLPFAFTLCATLNDAKGCFDFRVSNGQRAVVDAGREAYILCWVCEADVPRFEQRACRGLISRPLDPHQSLAG